MRGEQAIGAFRVTKPEVVKAVSDAVMGVHRDENDPVAQVIKFAHNPSKRINAYRAFTASGRCYEARERQWWVKSTWTVTRVAERDSKGVTPHGKQDQPEDRP